MPTILRSNQATTTASLPWVSVTLRYVLFDAVFPPTDDTTTMNTCSASPTSPSASVSKCPPSFSSSWRGAASHEHAANEVQAVPMSRNASWKCSAVTIALGSPI
ncbi:unnamed protein product, partial [Ectocarpus fasciculatus]